MNSEENNSMYLHVGEKPLFTFEAGSPLSKALMNDPKLAEQIGKIFREQT